MSTDHYEIEGLEAGEGIRRSARLLYVSAARYSGDWHSIPHTHGCAELFYVVGGVGQFRIAEQIRPVAADDLIIVNPGVEHTEVSLNASPLEYIVLGVEGLEFFAGEEGDHRYGIISLRGNNEDVLYLLRSLLRESEAKLPQYQIVCQDLLEVLVVRLTRRGGFSMALAPAGRRTNRDCSLVRRYIDDHFKENITLDHLAELAHLNKYHMAHLFSREYGISPINYLISRRIRESRYLLSETDHSLSQISHMLGFSSASYFSQSFRRLQGMSPMEYRKGKRLPPEGG